eukprot:scaffold134_cov94-Amphora_coffeaeformis.AAC.12
MVVDHFAGSLVNTCPWLGRGAVSGRPIVGQSLSRCDSCWWFAVVVVDHRSRRQVSTLLWMVVVTIS